MRQMAETLEKVVKERTTRRIDHFGEDAVPAGQCFVQLIEPLMSFRPFAKFGMGSHHPEGVGEDSPGDEL